MGILRYASAAAIFFSGQKNLHSTYPPSGQGNSSPLANNSKPNQRGDLASCSLTLKARTESKSSSAFLLIPFISVFVALSQHRYTHIQEKKMSALSLRRLLSSTHPPTSVSSIYQSHHQQQRLAYNLIQAAALTQTNASSNTRSLHTHIRTHTRATATAAASPAATSSRPSSVHWYKLAAVAATLAGASTLFAATSVRLDAKKEHEESAIKPGVFRKDLKTVSLDQVKIHDGKQGDGKIWVVYQQGVYDITQFVEAHPGGKSYIMRAAGSSIEPFWKMYAQHKEEFVYEILEEMRIANLDEKGQEEIKKLVAASNPYEKEPKRSPQLVVQGFTPFNAETPLDQLAENFITPSELFYIRNHLPVPVIDPKTYVMEISGRGLQQPVKLSLDDLKKFPKHEVIATIQCAGNRRNEMTDYKNVRGGNWEVGAISNAKWAGARLTDVLAHYGIKDHEGLGIKHIQFEGYDSDPATKSVYGASIPAEIGFDKSMDCILAYEMNDEAIPPDHGFPVRGITPGIVGARNVKWLSKVILSDEESWSHWQRKDYKGFSPNIDWHNVDFDSAPAIQELPVQSAICVPQPDTVISKTQKSVTVKGYAWSGGGREVIRVDVSGDDGKTWHTANIQQAPEQKRNRVWAWRLWQVDLPIPEDVAAKGGQLKLCCKATDSTYNTQPKEVGPIWNLRGVLNNAWHTVDVKVA